MKQDRKITFRLTEVESDNLDFVVKDMLSKLRYSWRGLSKSEAVRRLISDYCKANREDLVKKSDTISKKK
jgi:hypothetical protein